MTGVPVKAQRSGFHGEKEEQGNGRMTIFAPKAVKAFLFFRTWHLMTGKGKKHNLKGQRPHFAKVKFDCENVRALALMRFDRNDKIIK